VLTASSAGSAAGGVTRARDRGDSGSDAFCIEFIGLEVFDRLGVEVEVFSLLVLVALFGHLASSGLRAIRRGRATA
jgi:hypothetical protein